MPIIDGVGDEVLFATIFVAAPIFLLWHSLERSPFQWLQSGVYACYHFIVSLWTVVRARILGGREESAEGVSSSQAGIRGGVGFAMDGPPDNDLCSVCHDGFTLPCQANCSHWFCGECILRVWEHSSSLSPCRCPICRRSITLLIPSEALQAEQGNPLAQRILRDVANYNRRFGGGPVSLWQRLRDMPLLLQRLAWEFTDANRAFLLLHNIRILFCILLVVLYVLSPFDIIPEFALGLLGLLDDLLIVLFVAYYISTVYRSTLLGRNYFADGGYVAPVNY